MEVNQMIRIDFSYDFVRRLILEGWEDSYHHRVKGNTRILKKGEKVVAVVLPLRLPDGKSREIGIGIDYKAEVERFFRKLLDVLTKNAVDDVYLPGGGDVEIPKWFKDQCTEAGIRIHVLRIDNIGKMISELGD